MKKKILVIVILLAVLAAAAVLLIRPMVQGRNNTISEESADASVSLVCVFYANTYLSLDKDGCVCENTASKPQDIPVADGLDFTSLTFGKQAQCSQNGALDYVLKVAMCLSKQQIGVDKISYKDRMITIYKGQLEIQLGKNEKTDEKISDLNNFLDKIESERGVLYMQNANANNYGYTFRRK